MTSNRKAASILEMIASLPATPLHQFALFSFCISLPDCTSHQFENKLICFDASPSPIVNSFGGNEHVYSCSAYEPAALKAHPTKTCGKGDDYEIFPRIIRCTAGNPQQRNDYQHQQPGNGSSAYVTNDDGTVFSDPTPNSNVQYPKGTAPKTGQSSFFLP